MDVRNQGWNQYGNARRGNEKPHGRQGNEEAVSIKRRSYPSQVTFYGHTATTVNRRKRIHCGKLRTG